MELFNYHNKCNTLLYAIYFEHNLIKLELLNSFILFKWVFPFVLSCGNINWYGDGLINSPLDWVDWAVFFTMYVCWQCTLLPLNSFLCMIFTKETFTLRQYNLLCIISHMTSFGKGMAASHHVSQSFREMLLKLFFHLMSS